MSELKKMIALKHQNGACPKKIFRDLNGALDLTTIKRWCKMIDETGVIDLTSPLGRPRTIRNKDAISKIKRQIQQNKVSSLHVALQLDRSRTIAQRIFEMILAVDQICNWSNQHLPKSKKNKKEKYLLTGCEQIFESKKH
jgi:hypothetical protein